MTHPLRLCCAALFAGLLLFFGVGLFSPVATAVPAFARKTGLACSSCHEVWPRLNDFGQLFRDNGYRLKRDRDAPVQQSPDYWPIAMRTTVGYSWLRETLVPTDAGPVTTQTGTLGFSGLDVFAAGTLGDRVSFLVTYTPSLGSAGFGREPAEGDLESAFVGVHDLVGPWLNLRLGRHSIDLPEDEHRAITLTQGYNLYHYNIRGSRASFEAGENQLGLELYGHSDLSRVRYSLSLFNTNGAPLSNHAFSSPGVWGRVQVTQPLSNALLAQVKVGVFGGLGAVPTTASTLTAPAEGGGPGGPPEPVPGTFSALKQYRRYGADAHLYFLSTVNPLTVTGVLMGGSDDAALIEGADHGGTFLGGWAEVTYTPSIHLTLLGRWERIRTTDAGFASPFSAGDQTILTFAVRHTFELTNRTEAAVHAEFSLARQRDENGDLPNTTAALLGLDVAF
jgi:hypothetical protein